MDQSDVSISERHSAGARPRYSLTAIHSSVFTELSWFRNKMATSARLSLDVKMASRSIGIILDLLSDAKTDSKYI